ncbi:MAG: nitrilase-related carbon-nitrogen hydrolase [Campylobacterota bacterium]|nr:nitrilase-related carbon-nitrogen hydrolase [Campylobacterota bacterium]
MKVALIQHAPRLNRSNLERVLTFVQEHKENDALVFPELALSGYMLQDKLYEDAWELDELEPLRRASEDVDIAIGAAVKEEGRIYNTALYFSKGDLVHKHRKMHLPNYGMFEEARYFFKGESIELFESCFGQSAMLICEDLWRAETIATLAQLKPDIIFLHVASPARDFSDEGLLIESQWDALVKSTAIVCSAYVIFVNRVGFEDGIGFWGGSRVVTPLGEIEYRLGNFKEDVLSAELNHRLHTVQKWIAKKD